jgi:hypothetical protein
VEDLAKGYINAQQLIGTKRLPAPQANWTDSEWAGLYDQLGRPKTPDAYTPPADVKVHEKIKLDDGKMREVQTQFHRLGLTEKQGREVLGLYLKSLSGTVEAEEASRTQKQTEAMNTLKGQYGDAYEKKLEAGRLAVQKLGDEKLAGWIDESGIGNDPQFIGLMVKIGEMMSEDSTRSSGQSGNKGFSNEATAAQAEIGRLKTDVEFMRALMTQHHPGHAEATQRWTDLHYKGYPGKEQQ